MGERAIAEDFIRDFIEDLCRAIDRAINTGPHVGPSIDGALRAAWAYYNDLSEADRPAFIERLQEQGRERAGTAVARELDAIVRGLRGR